MFKNERCLVQQKTNLIRLTKIITTKRKTMWEVCRLCAEICDNLLPIFQKEGGRTNLDMKIKKCLSINISENDDKPKQMCYTCLAKLEEFNDFFDLCQSSNYKFETILYTDTTTLPAHTTDDSVILMRTDWDVDKSNMTVLNDNINQTNTMVQQSDGVIVVSKLDDQPTINDDCQDILLMVQLKYKDDQRLAEKQNNVIDKQQTVLRHSDDYNRTWKSMVHQPENVTLPEHQVQLKNPPSYTSESINNEIESKAKKPFPCTYCEKSFMRRSSLNAHISNHTNNKPFSCNLCDKSFAIRWDLTVHQRLHTGIFMCEFCKKVFAGKGKLERHRRIHTGEKPFTCEIQDCGKSFADKRNLETHKKFHTDVRPFGCKLCDKKFKNKAYLVDHQRVHSMDTYYTCETCGKSFKWKANLKIHVKNACCIKNRPISDNKILPS